MSSYPNDRRYAASHEWVKVEGNLATVGITHHAQDSLGDIVFVELPKVGAKLTRGQAFGVVESTKAVSELYAPVSGEVVEVNAPLPDAPETVNRDPHGDGWMVKLKADAAGEMDALMDAAAYEKFLADTSH